MGLKAPSVVLVLLLVLCAAGCGAGHSTSATTALTATHAAAPAGLHVGVVGPIAIRAPGAVVVRGSLSAMPGYRLVVVSARAATARAVAAAADAHPTAHYVLVGSRTRRSRRPSVAGAVLRDDQAAYLGGVVAALVADEEGGTQKRIAWVGPRAPALEAAFGRGAHRIDPAVGLLHARSNELPAACKEAALGVMGRGAVVVMAAAGPCADAAVAGAHQQNHVGLRLGDFELPSVAAAQFVRDAVAGVYHGGEDIVFGAASGAIGIRALDPRISSATAIAARDAAQEVAGRPRVSR